MAGLEGLVVALELDSPEYVTWDHRTQGKNGVKAIQQKQLPGVGLNCVVE